MYRSPLLNENPLNQVHGIQPNINGSDKIKSNLIMQDVSDLRNLRIYNEEL